MIYTLNGEDGTGTGRRKMSTEQAFNGCFMLCAGASMLIASLALILWVVR